MPPPERTTPDPRFEVTIDRREGFVRKRGAGEALAHEARGLRAVQSLGVAPPLISYADGELRTGYAGGRSRDLTRLTSAQAAQLGETLQRLHSGARRTSGYRPGWRSRARTISAYLRRRADEIRDGAPPHRHRLADGVVSAVPTRIGRSCDFALIHGDLVASNILWTPAPVLVDWEFWRSGDPAEDLAYVLSVNGVSGSAATALCRAYGDRSVIERIRLWQDLCRLEAALWYERHDDGVQAAKLFAALSRSG